MYVIILSLLILLIINYYFMIEQNFNSGLLILYYDYDTKFKSKLKNLA